MLYQRWQKTLARFAGDVAVVDLGNGGRRWTFQDLEFAASKKARSGAGPVEPVRWEPGKEVEFLVGVLAAWRDGVAVCPVELCMGELPEIPGEEIAKRGAGHLKITSGTTGSPRAIMFNDIQMYTDAANVVSTMGLRRGSPNVGVVSLAHSYGFSNLVLPLFLFGIPIVLAGMPLPGAVGAAVDSAESPVTLPAVPAMWKAWAAAGVLEKKKIRMGISAGAPLPLELEAGIYRSCGVKVHNFYGSSECGGIAFDRTEEPRADGSVVGAAVDGVTVEVGEAGRISVSGRAVGIGYWPPEEGGGEAFLEGGKFLTGDIGTVTEGVVRLAGRMGDVINVAGRKLAPESVEAVIRGDSTVSACVVFGVPAEDSGRTEEGVAIVCPGEGFDLGATRKRAGAVLASWQMPRRWVVETGLRVNARGKISRPEWRDWYLERRDLEK